MLLQLAEEVYNSCRSICLYECLYEYFRYCEKIRRDFINASEKEEGVLAQLLELYLKNEYLRRNRKHINNICENEGTAGRRQQYIWRLGE